MRLLPLLTTVVMLTWANYGRAADATSVPATIHVTLPADATLTINGDKTNATSSDRWFVTPELIPGKRYACVLKAEYMRDGERIVLERKVTLEAGRQVNVRLGPEPAYTSLFYDASAPRVERRAPPLRLPIPTRDMPTSWTGN